MAKPIEPLPLPPVFLYHNPWCLLAQRDPEVFAGTFSELQRQRNGLEMIASENMPSEAVLATLSSVANNKYAEGYPGMRYYGGCVEVDKTETLAIERAKALFGAQHANVQPHSGTTANQAVWYALMNPGDTILSMALDHGGHLSHGAPVNAVGKLYHIEHYRVDQQGLIDYGHIREQAKAVKPKVIIAGGSAYSRTIDFATFRSIADETGAYLVADIAHIAGLIAAGLHPSSIDHAHVTTTTTHKTLRGPRGGMILLGKDYDTPVASKGGQQIPLHRAINSAVFPGYQGGPLEHVIAAKAVAFGEALSPLGKGPGQDFVAYQRQVVANAKILALELGGEGYTLSGGGTDNHLVLLRNPHGLSGKAAQLATERIGITTNKNVVPYDQQKPTVTSGLRLGTPAITTRGIDGQDMREISDILHTLFSSTTEDASHTPLIEGSVAAALSTRVDALCTKRPLYEGMYQVMAHIEGLRSRGEIPPLAPDTPRISNTA